MKRVEKLKGIPAEKIEGEFPMWILWVTLPQFSQRTSVF